MKTRLTMLLMLVAGAGVMTALGAEPADASAATEAPGWLLDMVAKYPWLTTVLLIVGCLRLAVKPVFSIWHTYVASTETTEDDEFLAKVESSKALKWLLYVLDWTASIKLVKK